MSGIVASSASFDNLQLRLRYRITFCSAFRQFVKEISHQQHRLSVWSLPQSRNHRSGTSQMECLSNSKTLCMSCVAHAAFARAKDRLIINCRIYQPLGASPRFMVTTGR